MIHDESAYVWFTADTHFGHRAMVEREWGRKFPDIDTMDRAIIDQWNAVVSKRDTVFILGDFSFRNSAETVGIIGELNGRLHLIEGNHDRGLAKYALDLFDRVTPYLELKINGKRVCMSHYPFRSWHQMQYGSWQLHGHCHGNLAGRGRQLDVGMDSAYKLTGTYRPLHFGEIEEILERIPLWSEPTDHHQPKEGADRE
jgi:calcineurin-like phosphoesterase family protein